mmetsp:Transcript_22191/g.46513  ORF Transcript_22191/g.46513 Transcript_22191/m.46513 type:complete len:290 (+) Transcript_22191:128-997(+)
MVLHDFEGFGAPVGLEDFQLRLDSLDLLVFDQVPAPDAARKVEEDVLQGAVEAGFDVLERAKGHELALFEDADVVAERFALFHAVRGQHHRLVAGALRDGVPQRPAGFWVQPGGRLVQQHQRRVPDERDGDRHLPPIAPAEVAGLLMQVLPQAQAADQLGDTLGQAGPGLALDHAIELQLFQDSEPGQNRVRLGAVPHELGLALVLQEIHRPALAVDQNFAMRHRHRPCQDSEQARLASPIHSQQAKALGLFQAEGQPFDHDPPPIGHPQVTAEDQISVALRVWTVVER